MAGLTRNIVTSKNKARPVWPTPDMSLTPFFGMGTDYTGYTFFPSFANTDHARSSIKIHLQGTASPVLYYDDDGTQITDGDWSGTGLTVAEASANADHWGGFFMDSTDNALYIVSMDTGTTPDTLYFSKVDKAGTVTAIGSGVQLGNDSMSYSSNYMLSGGTGPIYRTGGDGSGNFVMPFSRTSDGNSAAGDPNRGVKITINASTGALSYSNLFGDNFGTNYAHSIYGAIGPTANNIYGGPWAGQSGYAQGQPWIASLHNLSTGRGLNRITLEGIPTDINGTSSMKAFRWRGLYVFANYSDVYGNRYYAEADMHNYIDEMAVYHGIL